MCVRECEETQVVSIQEESRDWLAIGKLPKCHTCEACKKLKGHDSWSTMGQKVQSSLTIISWLKLATCSSHEVESPECPILLKTDFSHSISYPTINTLMPTKCKGLRKRSLLREKKLKRGFYNTPTLLERELPILREKSS